MSSELDALINRYLSSPIIDSVRAKLSRELSPNLKFHSAAHTDDVIRETIIFAYTDQLAEGDIELLALAAAFHDVGYIEGASGHEVRSADYASRQLLGAGYPSDKVAIVNGMILDTCLAESPSGPAQKPSSELSRYLLDADLSNLGRDDFFSRLEDTALETGEDRNVVLQKALALISNHIWLTPAANQLRLSKQQENEAKLRRLIK